MTHFPPPPSELIDCPELVCGRVAELGFRKKGDLNAHLTNFHCRTMPRRGSGEDSLKKRSASPAEVEKPQKKTKRAHREIAETKADERDTSVGSIA